MSRRNQQTKITVPFSYFSPSVTSVAPVTAPSPTVVAEFVTLLLDWFHCGAQILLRDFKRCLDEGIQRIVEDWKKCGEEPEPATPEEDKKLFIRDLVCLTQKYDNENDLRYIRMCDVYLALRFVAISTNNVQHQRLPSLLSFSSPDEGLFATDEYVAIALRTVGIELEEWKGKLPGCDALPSSELEEIVDIFVVTSDSAFAHVCDILEPFGWKNPFNTRSPRQQKHLKHKKRKNLIVNTF